MQWISTFTTRIKNSCGRMLAPFKQAFQLAWSAPLDKEKEAELKKLFLSSDFGTKFTEELLDYLKSVRESSKLNDPAKLKVLLATFLKSRLNTKAPELQPCEDRTPKVVLFVGVNGSGKTTSLAKLGFLLQAQGHLCAFGAGDTFRAAAIEQLRIWSERLESPLIAQKIGADPAAVLFDAYNGAKKGGCSFLLADTAGRLTQPSLAKELQKIVKVLQKNSAHAPHETFCVLDATLGQNSLQQVEWFHQSIGLTGIILTKLDGTAKGGAIFDIYQRFKIPIRYVGFGEAVEDFQSFDPELFVESFLEEL